MTVKRDAEGQEKASSQNRGSECSTSGRNLAMNLLNSQISR